MEPVLVKPSLLRWARERAGLGLDTLQARFPKLADWESGLAFPSLKQVELLASAVHVPIGFLFLPDPPKERIPIPDFRTVANGGIRQPSPDLLDTIYLCQQRQVWFGEFSRATGARPSRWVGSASTSQDVIAAAARMRKELGLDLDERQRLPTWTEALRRFIEQADELGVLVMVSGVVGSNNHRKLDPDEFRGFALADEWAPLVFINGSDTKAAQMFTLAHELAHIWLGQSAVTDSQASQIPDQATERWCNQVAAELLVPLAVFKEHHDPRSDLQDETNRLAKRFKVSTLVILRRIFDTGTLNREAFWQAYGEELARLRNLPKGSGGDFYLTLGARASKTFARALVASTLEGRTPFTEAFRLLGFKKIATFREVGRNPGIAF